MSAFVTYNLDGFNADGLKVCTMPIRAVCKPLGHEAIAILREQFGEDVMAAEVTRSVPAKIGKYAGHPAHRIGTSKGSGMTLNSLDGIKYTMIDIQMTGGWGRRRVYKVTRKGDVLGYVARSLTRGSPARAGWSYCELDEPWWPHNWTKVGPGSTRDDAVDHLLSALSPSAAWLT